MDRRYFASGLAGLALLGPSCGSPPGNEPFPEDGLHRGNEAEPESLDPHAVRSVAALNISRDLGEGLVTVEADGELTPGAAKSWQVSEDGLRYRFQLRQQARWSNGDPLAAGDFVAGFRRLVNPATGAFYADLLANIVGAAAILRGQLPPEQLAVRAIGADELEIQLRSPTAYFLKLLTLPAAFPIHQPSLARYGERFARPGQLISNGAYRLSEWRVGSHIRLQRNEFYWDAANTSIARVWYYPTVDQVNELNRYRAGELHATANVPTQAFARLREQRPWELKVAPYLNTYYYGFNLSRVRQREETEIFRASWAGDYADPQTFAALLTSNNPANLTGYANPAYDALLARSAASAAPAERLDLLQQAERLMLNDAPLMPIYFYVSKHLIRPEVHGWHDNVLDIHLSRYLSIGGGA